MDEEHEKIAEIISQTFSWKLGPKRTPSGNWMSKPFPETGQFRRFYFIIKPCKDYYPSELLYLHENVAGTLKIFDVLIILRYNYEEKIVSLKDRLGFKSGIRNMYYLAEIQTNNLIEMTLTFSKIRSQGEIAICTGDQSAIESDSYDEVSKGNGDKTERNRQQIGKGDQSARESENYDEVSKGNRDKTERNEQQSWKGLVELSGDLKNLFLNEDDSDIVLNVGDKKYPAHKAIIKARSSVFRAMLKHDMSEKNQGAIDIPDCDSHIFQDFLLYLYAGKLNNLTNENVFELFYMSDKYDVNQLKLDCVDYIRTNMNTDSICDVISLATKHTECDLLQLAINFFTENAKAIFLTVKWQEFMKENPTQANELIIKAFDKASNK